LGVERRFRYCDEDVLADEDEAKNKAARFMVDEVDVDQIDLIDLLD
jgi:hypothetical protein